MMYESYFFFLMYFMYFLALKLSSTSSIIFTFLRGFRASSLALRSESDKVLRSKGSYEYRIIRLKFYWGSWGYLP